MSSTSDQVAAVASDSTNLSASAVAAHSVEDGNETEDEAEGIDYRSNVLGKRKPKFENKVFELTERHREVIERFLEINLERLKKKLLMYTNASASEQKNVWMRSFAHANPLLDENRLAWNDEVDVLVGIEVFRNNDDEWDEDHCWFQVEGVVQMCFELQNQLSTGYDEVFRFNAFTSKAQMKNKLETRFVFCLDCEKHLVEKGFQYCMECYPHALARSETCAICQDDETPDKCWVERNACGHVFHRSCHQKLGYNSKCPLCRNGETRNSLL